MECGPSVSPRRPRRGLAWDCYASCSGIGGRGNRRNTAMQGFSEPLAQTVKSRHVVPALDCFLCKGICGAASAPACVLQLVVSVVLPGPVHGAGGWACGEQAQLQDVFKGTRVRGNGIVLGHAELIGHARDSLAVRAAVSFHSIGSSCARAGSRAARAAATRPAERQRGRPPRTWGRSKREGRTPFVVESGPH